MSSALEFAFLDQFSHTMEVECPNCRGHARVQRLQTQPRSARFACVNCGKNQKWEGLSGVVQQSGPDLMAKQAVYLGKPVDAYFQYPLWLVFEFRGNTFFAYNREHLLFLKNYISDSLRKRSPDEHGWSNQSLQSRLPKWMLQSQNRDELLRKIAILEQKKED